MVSAQKREERLQDVPISISVLGGSELDKFTTEGLLDALGRVPGVITTSASGAGGGGAQLTVRGVSAGGVVFSGSSPIAYYLDSVPFGLVKSAIVPDSNIYDLERIEVLRGPQGTLYGASAQIGVVRILTKDPDLSEFGLKARASFSGTDNGGENHGADLAVTVPIVEGRLAASAVVGYEDMSGWIDKPNEDDVNDAQLRNLRLKVRGQPTNTLSIDLLAWLSRSDYGAPSGSTDEQTRSDPQDESASSDYDVFAFKLGYEASRFSITSTTSCIDHQSGNKLGLLPFGLPGVTLTTNLESTVLTEEIIINSSQSGSWRWSVGGIYRDAEDLTDQFGLGSDFNVTDKSESFAVFGEVTRAWLDGRVELTGGLRYFEDDVTGIENERSSPAGPPGLIVTNETFDKVSPRAVLSWHPQTNSTIYISYAEGFRSGFNQDPNVIRDAPEFPPVKSDNLKNYEVGGKGVLAGGRLGYEAALYYLDWSDVQQTLSVLSEGNPVTALVNADSASGLGLEVAVFAQPMDGLELGINFGWNDLAADNNLVTAGKSLYDKGDRLSFSPEYVAGASASYAFPLTDRYQATLSTSANYFSEVTYRNSLAPGVVNIDVGESQVVARIDISIDSPKGWTATAFVDNVNNEDGQGPGLFGIPDWTQRVRPRTFGLQVEYRFQ